MAFNKIIINQVAHYIPDIEEIHYLDPIYQAIYKIDRPFQEFLEQVLNFLPNSNTAYRDAYLRCFIQVLEKILKTEMFTLGEIGKLKPVVLTFLTTESPMIEGDPLLLQRALQVVSKYEIVDFSHTEKKILIVLEDTTNDKTLDVKVNIPKIVDTTIIISSRSNPALMELMYSKGFAAHEDYMTLAECRAVTNGQIEKLLDGNETVTDFREFKYFTGITATGEYFARNSVLERIHLPSTLKHIEGRFCSITSAAYNAGKRSQLVELEGVEQIESIGQNAFQLALKLKRLNFTNKLKSIGSGAFTSINESQEGSLISLGDTSGVEEFAVGGSRFFNQVHLSTIYMPKLSSITEYDFCHCKKLANITLDWDNIVSLPHVVFNDCPSLKEIPNINKCTTIAKYALSDCTSLERIGDMKLVETIGEGAFANDTNLTKVGKLDSCTTLIKEAFAGCDNLESIELPVCNSVGQYAFAVNEGTTTRRIIKFGLPYDQITFNASAFEGCTNTKIYCNEVELTAEQYQAVGATKPGE